MKRILLGIGSLLFLSVVIASCTSAQAANYTYESIATTPGILVKIDQATGRIVDIIDPSGRSVALLTNSAANAVLTGGVSTPVNGVAGSFTTLAASSTVSGTGFTNYFASPPAIGSTAAAAGSFTVLTTTSNTAATSASRVVLIGTVSDTLPASKATAFESANTASGAFTVTMAAPVGDGERRRICFLNLTGAITWAVTGPATTTSGLPATMNAGQCIEMIYNSVAGTPTNSAATTWYQY